jgi:hypothetical protein
MNEIPMSDGNPNALTYICKFHAWATVNNLVQDHCYEFVFNIRYLKFPIDCGPGGRRLLWRWRVSLCRLGYLFEKRLLVMVSVSRS